MAISKYMKVHGSLHTHTKFLALSGDATRLWLLCASWASNSGSDGRIPHQAARFLCMGQETAPARELVEAGLWDEVEGGWQFHDWDEWNATAAEIKARTEARSRGGKEAAKKRWGRRETVPPAAEHESDTLKSLDDDTVKSAERNYSSGHSLSNESTYAKDKTGQDSQAQDSEAKASYTTTLSGGNTNAGGRARKGAVRAGEKAALEALAKAFLDGKGRWSAVGGHGVIVSSPYEVERRVKSSGTALREMLAGGISAEALEACAYALAKEWDGRFNLTIDTLWRNWDRAQEVAARERSASASGSAGWMQFQGDPVQGDVVDVQ